MGISVLDERYRINGVIDTNKPVLENLTNLCNSCGTWLTYDNELGKWGIIINRSGVTSRSFDDSNIIGAIEVQGVGLRDLYNSVMASFPRNDDIRGERDYVSIEIDIGDRNPNEVDNQLEIEYDLVTDPVQAELLAFIELKQSRINRSIRFRTDFTSTGVKAGDVIDVTSTNYGFINELFRVITVTEVSDDNGSIVLDVLAMGYDDAVYDEDFTRYERTNQDGIVTIGAIGTPSTPQITKFENSVRPRLLLEATAPTGIVENMEFWLSYDNSDFNLLQAAPPYGGGVFTSGEEVEIDVDNVLSGNVYCKVRGINSTTVGPFSATASAIFAPRQTTDAIGPSTVAVDGGGNLATLLSVLALMELLDDLMDGSTTIGGLWDKIFSLFDDETGVDLRNLDRPPPGFDTFTLTSSIATVESKFNAFTGGTVTFGNDYTGNTSVKSDNLVLSFTLTQPIDNLMLVTTTPIGTYDYEYKDVAGSVATRTNFYAYIPSLIQVYRSNTKIQQSTVDWQTQNCIILIPNATAANYEIWIAPLPTYDLIQTTKPEVYPYNFDVSDQGQAAGSGITITAFGFTV
jgi:hypothetical protein